MTNVLIICIVIIVIALVVFFSFIIYHQMLLINEVNKRLMLMTKESIERERLTKEEYESLLQSYTSNVNEENNNHITETNEDNYDLNDLD